MRGGGEDSGVQGAASEPRSQADTTPVLLFDGVCNLCNSAVQWVIARDRRARFRFASLQSQAAVRLLSERVEADELPDSVVLVDERGIHTRSEAALGIAKALGFPYALLGLTRIVPRALRDATYDLVARNRYRWYGRQDTCTLPTPELATRFLDADEPRPHIEPPPPESRHAPSSRVSAWSVRFVIAYLMLYLTPFDTWAEALITGVGARAFGVEATLEVTGSGDRTYNYLALFVEVVVAFLIAIAWTLAARAKAVSERTFDISRTLARFYLGYTMLVYGWIKLFPLQFPQPAPDRFILPYGDSSPMGLAWTFLGASVGYQMFAGLSELVGGYLLFWRRTALLGALASAAVLTNVVAINLFYDVPVKLFSGHLLLFALFIMAPDLPRLVGLLGFRLPVAPRRDTPFWAGWGRLRIAVIALHLVFVVGITTQFVQNNLAASRARGVLAEPHPLTGVYRVESFVRGGVGDRENEDRVRWVRFGLNAPFTATVQWASGDAERMRLQLDSTGRTLSIFDRGAQPPEEPTFTYSEPSTGLLRLEGEFAGEPTTILMRKDESGALLTSRGFRWINEFPFNR